MIDHLLTIKTAVDTARDAGLAALPAEDLDRFHKRYLRIVEAGYAQNPVTESSAGPKRRGRRKQSKARNLLDRFRDHPDGILAFMRDFPVPFDNNLCYAASGITEVMPTAGLCRVDVSDRRDVRGIPDFQYMVGRHNQRLSRKVSKGSEGK